MSFEYIIEKDNSTKKLSTEEESILIKKISSKFSALNSERAHNLEMASNLANEIFFKNDFKSISDKSQKWKAKSQNVQNIYVLPNAQSLYLEKYLCKC